MLGNVVFILGEHVPSKNQGFYNVGGKNETGRLFQRWGIWEEEQIGVVRVGDKFLLGWISEEKTSSLQLHHCASTPVLSFPLDLLARTSSCITQHT